MSKCRVRLVGHPPRKLAGLRLYDLRPEETVKHITALALSFPSLRSALGISPWKPKVFDAWGAGQSDFNAKTAVTFVLAVWEIAYPWRCGRFDLLGSYELLNEQHQAVILAWTESPWWCSKLPLPDGPALK